jgi:hypothetical protein
MCQAREVCGHACVWLGDIFCLFPRFFDWKEEFEDTKSVIRFRNSKDRQHKGQNKKVKQGFTKYTHKTKRSSNTNPLNTMAELSCSGSVSSSCSTSCTRRVNLVINPVISHDIVVLFYISFHYIKWNVLVQKDLLLVNVYLRSNHR